MKKPLESNKELREAFRQVSKTKAGQTVLKWLMGYCGYHDCSTVRQVTIAPDGKSQILGDILPLASIHNESKRATWADVRKLIPAPQLIQIEHNQEASNENQPQTD